MNELTIFNSPKFGAVRTVTDENGKVLFCGSDVAKALGYVNTKDALARHCKTDGVVFHDLIDSIGRVQQAKFITEGNVYRLITHSKLPEAEQFEAWVFEEILPSVRKHGAYMTEQTLEKALTSPDFLIQLATQLKAEQEQRKALETTIAVQNQQIAELTPKAGYYDAIINCPELIATSVIAKDYGKSAVWLNRKLHEKKVQYKQGKTWLLYQKYADKGYTGTKTTPYPKADGSFGTTTNTYWTQKGRTFIYELLKAENILPIMEKERE